MELWWSATSADASAEDLVLQSTLSTLGTQTASPLYGSVHDASDAPAWQMTLYKLRICEAAACLSWEVESSDSMARYGWERRKTSRKRERLESLRSVST
jgi:hypothetical protein